MLFKSKLLILLASAGVVGGTGVYYGVIKDKDDGAKDKKEEKREQPLQNDAGKANLPNKVQNRAQTS